MNALLIGLGTLLACQLSYALATAFIIHLVVSLIRKGYAGRSLWKNIAIMTIVTLLTAAGHLIQIAIWAITLLLVGEMPNFEKAFYYSAENYTALGYDSVLSARWRLLGPLEAINGLLLFGLSTAVMFAILSRLIASRLGHRQEQADGAAATDRGE
ncbi:MAG TPA: ion channel [Gemmataceae bacterium]|nr:ion channel [Gemmataceae bacterium]